jgi:hypothetical protein
MTGHMKVNNVHEGVFGAAADELAALVADFDRICPTDIGPVPRPVVGRVYRAGMMVWEEFDRRGAIRAFRVVRPEALRAEHWFDLERVDEGLRLRHTIAGEAVGGYESIWCERTPAHDQVLDALLGKIEVVLSGPST